MEIKIKAQSIRFQPEALTKVPFTQTGAFIAFRTAFLFSLPCWLTLAGFFTKANAYVDELDARPGILTRYKPVYFLAAHLHSKFQISLKGQLIESTPVYFGYTQTSLWDVGRVSAPFSDTAYSPDLFYRIIRNVQNDEQIDLGGQHESNGRDGDASRAWNRIFVAFRT